MRKRGFLMRWIGMLLAVTIVLVFGLGARGDARRPDEPMMKRADILNIDVLKAFGPLELPPVEFHHDAHTDALDKQNKDCQACHLMDKDRVVPKFKRLKDVNRREVMDLYHDQCQSCHREMAAAGEKAGPLVCRECHRSRPQAADGRLPMELGKNLHFRHAKASEDKCERCHHEYDGKSMKLVYVKGKEGSCRYCHREVTQENRVSMRLASHLDCLNCHKKTAAEKKKAGPTKCAGCHDAAKRQAIEKVADVPRVKRNQPDMVLVKTVVAEPGAKAVVPDGSIKMTPVPFDHQAHEGYNDTCRVCHHRALDACAKCHTVDGNKDGGFVQLEQAMHRVGNNESCRGCHARIQERKECAGCHGLTPKVQPMTGDAGCRKCHMGQPPQLPEGATALAPLAEQAFVADQLKARRFVDDSIKLEDIPEKVVIRELENQYKPADFPHRKIVQTLMGNMKDNKLAGYYHADPATVCQSCHHHAPAVQKPTRCWNCHGQPFAPQNPARPGMKAAYHLQCMGCHQRMGLVKPAATACNACHEEKQK